MDVRALWATPLALAAVGAIGLGGCGGGATGASVPAGAHAVRIVSAVSGERPIVAVGVTDPGTVRQIVAWINEMRRVPAGVAYSCPAYPGIEPTVTLTFRAHLHGAVLATAFETDPGYGSTPCNPLTINIPGRAQRRLVGGSFLERVQRLLGVDLGFGFGRIEGEIKLGGGSGSSRRQRKGPLAGTVSVYLPNPRAHPGYGPGSAASAGAKVRPRVPRN